MPSMRAKLILTTIGGALALLIGGCVAPWSAPASNHEHAKTTAVGTMSLPGPGPVNSQADQGAGSLDMASVLDKIQQVRAMDPGAEQSLLDELRRVPPASWPLVAEQFRATLAYHEQLAAKARSGPREVQPVVDLRRAPPTDTIVAAEPRPIRASGPAYQQSAASIDDRPSAPIGSLVDPHGANSEAAHLFARSMPYAMPSPVAEIAASRSGPVAPAPFSGDRPMYPIAGRGDATADLAASNGLAGERPHVATQAAAQAIEAPKQLPLPQGTGSDENWQQLVQKAIADLNHHVSDSPTTTAEVHQHVSLRILQLLAGDTEKALEPIPHISPTEQDYWSRQLFALATYLDHHSQPDDKHRAAASVTHLDEAVSNLRELGSLSLRNLSFCKNVYGYGAIEPYESDTFTPGQHVSLYVEVENFHSTSSEKGYSSSLGSTYELLDEKGKRVANGDFPDVNDCCRNRRRDFHIQFGLTLPENIAPGRYQLQLVVKDRQSDKIGNAKASFEIHGKK